MADISTEVNNSTLVVGDIQFKGTNDLKVPYQILTSSGKGVEFIVGDRDSDEFEQYPYLQVIAEPGSGATIDSKAKYKVGINYNADFISMNNYPVLTGLDINHDIESAIMYIRRGFASTDLNNDDLWKEFNDI